MPKRRSNMEYIWDAFMTKFDDFLRVGPAQVFILEVFWVYAEYGETKARERIEQEKQNG
jgi:hypothetical protein